MPEPCITQPPALALPFLQLGRCSSLEEAIGLAKAILVAKFVHAKVLDQRLGPRQAPILLVVSQIPALGLGHCKKEPSQMSATKRTARMSLGTLMEGEAEASSAGGGSPARPRGGSHHSRIVRGRDKPARSPGVPRKTLRKAELPKKKKIRRKRPGANALSEIRKYQGRRIVDDDGQEMRVSYPVAYDKTSTELLIPKAAFQRIVKEIARELKSDIRMTVDAIEALQAASESHLVSVFQDANLCCINSGRRQTLLWRDMRLAQWIRREPIPDLEWLMKPNNWGLYHRDGENGAADLERADGVAMGPSL